ncbi:hypothetical protein BTW15_29975 [Pseudomonas syringae pv. tomato]|uniref:Uncharacterized protein n=2 Tax=Pseudomonas syringae group TaxID=136849 RepID=A0A3M5TJM1_9PSED|nr:MULTISPECIES: hypothetical protein [Pseudomonas syringae group]KPW70619.1 hypothetical protein ALO78_200070 [Pseudomonas amygdali pv. ciccaronei]RMR72106.1 hypothetical protein ALP82_200122 [Pseudomonas savastanoi pv. fraxini]RMU33167.1 hypothetical protein ALP32_200002 [Pseudomonas avellanae]KUR47135.1 hypothetical protein PST407_02813 [Pseudomonas syringae pv. tomato]MBI6850102.1 hypothetical protein [Pseudomonas syringae]
MDHKIVSHSGEELTVRIERHPEGQILPLPTVIRTKSLKELLGTKYSDIMGSTPSALPRKEQS